MKYLVAFTFFFGACSSLQNQVLMRFNGLSLPHGRRASFGYGALAILPFLDSVSGILLRSTGSLAGAP
ncbi:hypothetical protein [Adhaeribacter radiodurans]|uniref:Uncharacterized protein n=1 Tax=Adhaeribacter radiodurans TaxID=2745197 RepID=A0A7L7L415_9BACT|nr:hypothetical protein [Adhaeribacter radiodurans]QMU27547.1 hypothetical protein HUW48_05610 [Adhaeribacter radiodurans]